eukprot:CAMPEP_0184682116 /NCGR_PEP_ID=MMETSP0312-20130426/5852_1 /TAXON_ID=31354 /ORGANISM="Compsopogon coeruleus, Strain SAG 36.94" /LENGTH=418 /DNA_ID=CAMNT_0027133503 /DNA_START=18 /DNA_END=1271 /DNA_ORIENTATION=+
MDKHLPGFAMVLILSISSLNIQAISTYEPSNPVLSLQNGLNAMDRSLLRAQLSDFNHESLQRFLTAYKFPQVSLPGIMEYWITKEPIGLAIFNDFVQGLIPSGAHLPMTINPVAVDSMWASRFVDQDLENNATSSALPSRMVAEEAVNNISSTANRVLDLPSVGRTCIGIVFHVFFYQDADGVWGPADISQVYSDLERVVDQMNLQYAKVTSEKLQFYVAQIRTPVSGSYPYLQAANWNEWVSISAFTPCTPEDRITPLAAQYNAPENEFINVFVGGEWYNGVGCSNVPGQASVGSATKIFMPWTLLDSARYNRPEANEYGASYLTHEFGHYLGLRHTFQGVFATGSCTSSGGCTCTVASGGDLVSDTPAELQSDQFNQNALNRFCRSPAVTQQPFPPNSRAFDLCANLPGYANIFNW